MSDDLRGALATAEAQARSVIRIHGPLGAFRHLIAENNAVICRPELGNGRAIGTERTAIHTALVGDWAAEQEDAFGYGNPFAVVALGGTGRGEMSPCSDNDFAFLFDETLEGNAFLLELQRQVVHSDEFENRCGFACLALPFSLDDVPSLGGKQLNSFLDMRAVYDPHGLADAFRERIRSTCDPFEHFLHIRGFWKDQWEKAAGESERVDRFDIKNDGLRVFLAGIWALAGKRFLHSHEVYETLEDPRDLDAYGFLLRIRAFAHLRAAGPTRRSTGGNHPEDVLGFDDFISFDEMLGPAADERTRFEFANDVRARLLSARRRVARFARSAFERELKNGREVSPGNPIRYGVGGLFHEPPASSPTLPGEKSRAALALLLASQRYSVAIDLAELQTTFRDAGDWLTPVPGLSALFYEQRGSLADSLRFLSQLDGAMERLFPGYAKFEASVDLRVMSERTSLRGALGRQKLQALDGFLQEGHSRLAAAVSAARLTDPSLGVLAAVEAALLDADHLAAVKLALHTKRLPLTADELALRQDESRPLRERHSSGFSNIPLSDYYLPYAEYCDMSSETVRLAEFLVANRRAFKERSATGINDAWQIKEFAALTQSESFLRALFVFTCADRAEWESAETDPARWFNTRELYAKTRMWFRPAGDPARALTAAGYSREQLEILLDFGEDFFGGVYRQYANRFGAHLVRLVEEPQLLSPAASLLRDGTSIIVGVAARDYRGLAASISGALWHQKIDLRQAHLFSAMNHGLALDFYHVSPRDRPLTSELPRVIEQAIEQQLYIDAANEADLPAIVGRTSLREWRPGQYCLRLETSAEVGGHIYALTYKIFRHLGGNIFGLSAHGERGRAFVSVYHSLPVGLSLQRAQAIIAERFR